MVSLHYMLCVNFFLVEIINLTSRSMETRISTIFVSGLKSWNSKSPKWGDMATNTKQKRAHSLFLFKPIRATHVHVQDIVLQFLERIIASVPFCVFVIIVCKLYLVCRHYCKNLRLISLRSQLSVGSLFKSRLTLFRPV